MAALPVLRQRIKALAATKRLAKLLGGLDQLYRGPTQRLGRVEPFGNDGDCDLLMHHSVALPLSLIESMMLGQVTRNEPGQGSIRIPFDERPIELRGQPPVLSSGLMERHDDLMAYVFERLNWAPGDFRACRLLVRYPPMHTTVLLRFPLPQRP